MIKLLLKENMKIYKEQWPTNFSVGLGYAF